MNWLGSKAQKSLARLEDTAIRDRKRKEILHGHGCLESLTISGPLPTGTEIEKTENHDTQKASPAKQTTIIKNRDRKVIFLSLNAQSLKNLTVLSSGTDSEKGICVVPEIQKLSPDKLIPSIKQRLKG